MHVLLTSFFALTERVIEWAVSDRVVEDAEVRGGDRVSSAAAVATVTAKPAIRGRLCVNTACAAAALGEGRGRTVPIRNILWLGCVGQKQFLLIGFHQTLH